MTSFLHQLMEENQEKTSDMGLLWCFIADMAMEGLVPLVSRAMMVTGTIQLQSAKVRLIFKEGQVLSWLTQQEKIKQQNNDSKKKDSRSSIT